MRALAWLAALGARPRPDVRILELAPTDAGTFTALIQNQGSAPCRCGIAATVGTRTADCSPAIVDLLPNGSPTRIRIHDPVPQPGAELTVSVNDGRRVTSATLRESVSGEPFGG